MREEGESEGKEGKEGEEGEEELGGEERLERVKVMGRTHCMENKTL